MTKTPFSQLNLTPKVEKAINEMGFELATPIQSEAIPIIRTGADVIARSQTGTGKTIAFAIPAIERVDTHEEKITVQVLILCPTRELAQQTADEIRKVARYKLGIHPVEIYGGAAIDKQCIRLRRANIVIGTPGRIMDHMRRKTLKLDNVKMVVLDESDEMLNMGFKEDIETILNDVPEDRQTVLFSATMPPAILKLTQEFLKSPTLIETDKDQVTIEDIEQQYVEVPRDRKKDALVAFLQFYDPTRAIIFTNTKKMADELLEILLGFHFSADCIHSDIKQSQRTAVMQSFKQGHISILLATDIAARGIDVSDVDFVINYDIPANSEFYVHRIGRTGRAGKSGRTITLCVGRREVSIIRGIAAEAKSVISRLDLPSTDAMKKNRSARLLQSMEEAMREEPQSIYTELADKLVEKGYTARNIAAVAMGLVFANEAPITELPVIEPQIMKRVTKVKREKDSFKQKQPKREAIIIDIGSSRRVTVNHIIGALTERTSLMGGDIGKVDVFLNETVVDIPASLVDEVLEAMTGCKITGLLVRTQRLAEPGKKRRNSHKDSLKTTDYVR